ncbi:hypothetical protein GCM10027066_20400 [Dyella jejuensis]
MDDDERAFPAAMRDPCMQRIGLSTFYRDGRVPDAAKKLPDRGKWGPGTALFFRPRSVPILADPP